MDKLIVGAHGPNQRLFSPNEESRFRAGRFTGLVLMWYHDPRIARKLGVEPEDCVVRLPDSVFDRWEGGKPVAKYVPSATDYARAVKETIERFFEFGFRHFQWDNEPDLSWEKLGLSDSGWDWCWFTHYAIEALTNEKCEATYLPREVWESVKLGLTPISQGWRFKSWKAAVNHNTLLPFFKWAAGHCYWQASGDMGSKQFGGNWQLLIEDFGLPVRITEAGNSSIQLRRNPPTLEQVERLQAEQYPRYLETLYPAKSVEAVYFYILGGSGWDGFYLTRPICDALAARLEPYRPHEPGHNGHTGGGGGNLGNRSYME